MSLPNVSWGVVLTDYFGHLAGMDQLPYGQLIEGQYRAFGTRF